MITIQASGNISGVSANNNSVGYTITGMELAAGNETYKVLAQGNLSTVAGNLYAAPANTTSFVKRIFLVNQTTSTQAGVILYLSGTGAAPAVGTQMTGNMSIPANGSMVYDETGWTSYDGNTNVLVSSAAPGRLKSIQVLNPGNTNYITPAGTNVIFIECIGPGGGGGGANANATNNSAYGAGGGAGGYAAKVLVGPLSANYTVAVGTGGAGGNAAGGNGVAGSANTTFNTGVVTITASLGNFGVGQTGGATIASVAGGVGGTAANGDINVKGGNGWDGGRYTTVITTGVPTGRAGPGGTPARYGGTNPVGLDGVTAAGIVTQLYGQGGTGGAANGSAAANGTGSAGANGVIIVWEYY